MMEAAGEITHVIERLAQRRLDERVVEAAIWAGGPRQADLADADALRSRVAPAIEQSLAALHPEALPVQWSVEPEPEHGGHRLVALTRRSGVALRTELDAEQLARRTSCVSSSWRRGSRRSGSAPYRILGDAEEQEEYAGRDPAPGAGARAGAQGPHRSSATRASAR